MGLDMYVYAATKAVLNPDADVDFETGARYKEPYNHEDPYIEGVEQVHYWRKHHDLHGWFQQLYNDKGGASPEFNGDTVRLYEADLDLLERDMCAGNLPHTEGFFFGNNPPDAESLLDDLQFIEKARKVLKDGKVVYYDSSW